MSVSTENVQKWREVTKDMRSLEEKYYQDNLEYKDVARQVFIDEMGFEPPLEASMAAEFFHRSTLKLFDEGGTTKERLQRALTIRALSLRNILFCDFPQFRELASKYNKPHPGELNPLVQHS